MNGKVLAEQRYKKYRQIGGNEENMNGLQLIATGGALPGRTVTNEDLSRVVGHQRRVDHHRTGIRTRHWCRGERGHPGDRAARQALERSGLTPEQMAGCAQATLSAPDVTPERGLSGTACAGPARRPPGL